MAVNRCKGWIIGGVVAGIAVVVVAARFRRHEPVTT
jgi:hypothetical protein